jgi:hypothetical protein
MKNSKKYTFTVIILLLSGMVLYYMVTDWIPATNARHNNDPYDTMK